MTHTEKEISKKWIDDKYFNHSLQMFFVCFVFFALMTVMMLAKENTWQIIMGIIAILFALYGAIIAIKGKNKYDALDFMQRNGMTFTEAIESLKLFPRRS